MSVLSLQDTIKKPDVNKSRFDLSHTHVTTGHFGQLIPVGCFEVVPGDEWSMDISHFIRILPLSGPVPTRVDVMIHGFFVPNRIVWDEWEEFITGRSASFIPTQNLNAVNLDDDECVGVAYGLPKKTYAASNFWVQLLPARGYAKIYNDYYRNKVIQDEIDITAFYYNNKLKQRNWRKDYFTSAVPYPQLGDASQVSMDVSYLTKTTILSFGGGSPNAGTLKVGTDNYLEDVNNVDARAENIDEILMDVNDMRYAYAYQDWLVRMLKSGDHYADHLLNVFGVKSSDARFQRVEYIGGYSSPLIVNEVTQMTEVIDSGDLTYTPLGTQGGSGQSYGSGERLYKFIEEHGYIHVIMSVLPKSAHYGGIDKMFSKTLPLDFYFPQFAYLPEQEILKQEVFHKQDATDTDVFGYIERYAEYKHYNDRISGKMIDDFKHLHFANIYTIQQSLNDTFLQAIVREDAFAVANDIHFFGQIGFNIDANRPMPFNVDGVNLV